jgi:hypothetical protein
MTRALLLVALLSALGACSDGPTLLVRIQHPKAFDPAIGAGKLTVELLDGNTGHVEQRKEVGTTSLAARQRLFEGLELVEGRSYRVQLSASFDAGEAVCAGSGRRAVGRSPSFRYDEALGELPIYMDCADAASSAGPLTYERFYHSAVFLPGASAHGQVVVMGGIKPEMDSTKPLTYLDSIEVYDPATDRFNALSASLTRPRAYLQAVAVGADEALALGGLVEVEIGGVKGNAAVNRVDQIKGGRVAKAQDMTQIRAGHSAVLLEDSQQVLVVAGQVSLNAFPLTSLELFDPAGGKVPGLPSLQVPRYQPAVVALGGGRNVLVAGGLHIKGQELFFELVCRSGSCPCGAAPCVHTTKGFGKDEGRYGVTATHVPCETSGGAVYLVGGSHPLDPICPPGSQCPPAELAKQDRVYDEILCVDAADPAAGPMNVGKLLKPRVGHTTTLVRGAGGSQRLFVAGGYTTRDTTTGNPLYTTLGELVPVTCSCKSVGKVKEIDLGTIRVGHTTTRLADGSVLLVGGFTTDWVQRFNPDF